MNNFLKCLQQNGLLNSFVKDEDDINFLSSLNEIIIQQKVSLQGKTQKRNYFNWFVIINNEKHALNLSRTDLQYVKYPIKTYCKSCRQIFRK